MTILFLEFAETEYMFLGIIICPPWYIVNTA